MDFRSLSAFKNSRLGRLKTRERTTQNQVLQGWTTREYSGLITVINSDHTLLLSRFIVIYFFYVGTFCFVRLSTNNGVIDKGHIVLPDQQLCGQSFDRNVSGHTHQRESFARCHKTHFAAVVCGGCIANRCRRCRLG